jgi:DNA-binding cell septation regulator SpoVG
MEITDVKIFKAKQRGQVLAYANVILDSRFIIRGITLLETDKNGRFISMPSRLLKNENKKSYRDVCHPLNSTVRNELTERIFAAYDEFVEIEK